MSGHSLCVWQKKHFDIERNVKILWFDEIFRITSLVVVIGFHYNMAYTCLIFTLSLYLYRTIPNDLMTLDCKRNEIHIIKIILNLNGIWSKPLLFFLMNSYLRKDILHLLNVFWLTSCCMVPYTRNMSLTYLFQYYVSELFKAHRLINSRDQC